MGAHAPDLNTVIAHMGSGLDSRIHFVVPFLGSFALIDTTATCHYSEETMRTHFARRSAGFILAAISVVLPALADTRDILDAPVVNETIGVGWNSTGKTLQTSLDSGRFLDLPEGALFEAKGTVLLTYPQLNPLRVRVSNSIKEVDDPTYLALVEFLKAAQSLTKLLVPTKETTNQTQEFSKANVATCKTPYDEFTSLRKDLFLTEYKEDPTATLDELPGVLEKQYKSWTELIDAAIANRRAGWEAVAAGGVGITGMTDDLKKKLDSARDRYKEMQVCTQESRLTQELRAIYSLLLGGVGERIRDIEEIRSALVALEKSLNDGYVQDTTGPLRSKWTGPLSQDYVVAQIAPTRQKMIEVTVKLESVTHSLASITNTFSLTTKEIGSGKFTVQRYSPYIIEPSVGAVFGILKQPTYGTATNEAGETIVARAPDNALSVNPGVMVNFVCRCAGGLPMLQLGVSASKDLPAFLAGGGIRLFGLGAGDFGLSYGAMIGWYRDLNKLKVGDVVQGTKDIEADLQFINKPHIKSYFAIHYQF